MSQKELYDLAEQIRRCTKCPLWKGRTLAVPGDGAEKAKIMIIGEAPGAEEDRQGLPFVGRAGKLLNEMLNIAGWKRPEVFITNCVKCRPPKNRAPQKEELKNCREWLNQQIEFIKPELVVVLGRVASSQLLGKDKIKDIHGKVISQEGQKYFVTYHPSAGLRFKKFKEKLKEDFLVLGKLNYLG